MKSIKVTSDVMLGLSAVLFSYVYWFAFRIERQGTSGMSSNDITDVTVNLFYVALLLSVLSATLRAIAIKKMKVPSKLNLLLLAISLVPLLKWIVQGLIYEAN